MKKFNLVIVEGLFVFVIVSIMMFLLLSCKKETTPIRDVPIVQEVQAPTRVVKTLKFRWKNEYRDYALVKAIKDHGKILLSKKPNDYQQYIKTWPTTENELIQFWGNILVEMAYFESKWKGSAKYRESFRDNSGKRIWSRGLFQLSLESGKGYKCDFKTDSDLHIDSRNIQCAVIILNRWLDRDGVIAGKKRGKWQGGARYWAVLRGFNDHTRNALKQIKNINQ